MTRPIQPSNTAAYYVQAILSFAISLAAMGLALIYLPAAGWVQAFLALGLLFVVPSTITLSKVIRDR